MSFDENVKDGALTESGVLAVLKHWPCGECGARGVLRVEWRDELVAKPLGTHSLSGSTPKVSATEREWPWLVCDGCGAESRGKIG